MDWLILHNTDDPDLMLAMLAKVPKTQPSQVYSPAMKTAGVHCVQHVKSFGVHATANLAYLSQVPAVHEKLLKDTRLKVLDALLHNPSADMDVKYQALVRISKKSAFQAETGTHAFMYYMSLQTTADDVIKLLDDKDLRNIRVAAVPSVPLKGDTLNYWLAVTTEHGVSAPDGRPRSRGRYGNVNTRPVSDAVRQIVEPGELEEVYLDHATYRTGILSEMASRAIDKLGRVSDLKEVFFNQLVGGTLSTVDAHVGVQELCNMQLQYLTAYSSYLQEGVSGGTFAGPAKIMYDRLAELGSFWQVANWLVQASDFDVELFNRYLDDYPDQVTLHMVHAFATSRSFTGGTEWLLNKALETRFSRDLPAEYTPFRTPYRSFEDSPRTVDLSKLTPTSLLWLAARGFDPALKAWDELHPNLAAIPAEFDRAGSELWLARGAMHPLRMHQYLASVGNEINRGYTQGSLAIQIASMYLGTDANAWSQLSELHANWEGTIPELCETAAVLAGIDVPDIQEMIEAEFGPTPDTSEVVPPEPEIELVEEAGGQLAIAV